ncbi:MAG TPA: hypothetical protein DCL49_04270, partial [Candidatus Omnitrophica bacterium]|nr:hypothetical protein [Candidatus Omnitrophota bacterium]
QNAYKWDKKQGSLVYVKPVSYYFSNKPYHATAITSRDDGTYIAWGNTYSNKDGRFTLTGREPLEGSKVIVDGKEIALSKIGEKTPGEWISHINKQSETAGTIGPISPKVSLGDGASSEKRKLLEQLNKSDWGSFTAKSDAQKFIKIAAQEGALPGFYAAKDIILGGYSVVAPSAAINLVYHPVNNLLLLEYMGDGHKNFLFYGLVKGKGLAQSNNSTIEGMNNTKLSFVSAQMGNKAVWGAKGGALISKEFSDSALKPRIDSDTFSLNNNLSKSLASKILKNPGDGITNLAGNDIKVSYVSDSGERMIGYIDIKDLPKEAFKDMSGVKLSSSQINNKPGGLFESKNNYVSVSYSDPATASKTTGYVKKEDLLNTEAAQAGKPEVNEAINSLQGAEGETSAAGIYHSQNRNGDKNGQAYISAIITDPAAIVNRWASIQNNYRKDGHFDAVSFVESGRVSEIADVSVKSMRLSHYRGKNKSINNIAYSPAGRVDGFLAADLINSWERSVPNGAKDGILQGQDCSEAGCSNIKVNAGKSFDFGRKDDVNYFFGLHKEGDTVVLKKSLDGELFPALSDKDVARLKNKVELPSYVDKDGVVRKSVFDPKDPNKIQGYDSKTRLITNAKPENNIELSHIHELLIISNRIISGGAIVETGLGYSYKNEGINEEGHIIFKPVLHYGYTKTEQGITRSFGGFIEGQDGRINVFDDNNQPLTPKVKAESFIKKYNASGKELLRVSAEAIQKGLKFEKRVITPEGITRNKLSGFVGQLPNNIDWPEQEVLIKKLNDLAKDPAFDSNPERKKEAFEAIKQLSPSLMVNEKAIDNMDSGRYSKITDLIQKTFADTHVTFLEIKANKGWTALAISDLPSSSNSETKPIFLTRTRGDIISTSKDGKINKYAGKIEATFGEGQGLDYHIFSPGAEWRLPEKGKGITFITDRWTWLSTKERRGGISISLGGTPYGWAGERTVSRVGNKKFTWVYNKNITKSDIISHYSQLFKLSLIVKGKAEFDNMLKDKIGAGAQGSSLIIGIGGNSITLLPNEIDLLNKYFVSGKDSSQDISNKYDEVLKRLAGDKLSGEELLGTIGLKTVIDSEKKTIEIKNNDKEIIFKIDPKDIADALNNGAGFNKTVEGICEKLNAQNALPENLTIKAKLEITGKGDLLWGKKGLEKVYSGYGKGFKTASEKLTVAGYAPGNKKLFDESYDSIGFIKEGKISPSTKEMINFSDPFKAEKGDNPEPRFNDLTLQISPVSDNLSGLPFTRYTALPGDIPLGITYIEPGFAQKEHEGNLDINTVFRAGKYRGKGGLFADPRSGSIRRWNEGSGIDFIEHKDKSGKLGYESRIIAPDNSVKTWLNEVILVQNRHSSQIGNFYFQGIKASTSLSFAPLGEASTLLPEGKLIVGDKVAYIGKEKHQKDGKEIDTSVVEIGGEKILFEKENITIKDLADKLSEKGLADVSQQILQDNFSAWKPSENEKGVGFSSLYAERSDNSGQYTAVPFIGSQWDAKAGLVASWGGGEDVWIKMYAHNLPVGQGDAKDQKPQTEIKDIIFNKYYNIYLAKGRVEGAGNVIQANVFGNSPTGEQRRLSEISHLSSIYSQPTSGILETRYEFLSPEEDISSDSFWDPIFANSGINPDKLKAAKITEENNEIKVRYNDKDMSLKDFVTEAGGNYDKFTAGLNGRLENIKSVGLTFANKSETANASSDSERTFFSLNQKNIGGLNIERGEGGKMVITADAGNTGILEQVSLESKKIDTGDITTEKMTITQQALGKFYAKKTENQNDQQNKYVPLNQMEAKLVRKTVGITEQGKFKPMFDKLIGNIDREIETIDFLIKNPQKAKAIVNLVNRYAEDKKAIDFILSDNDLDKAENFSDESKYNLNNDEIKELIIEISGLLKDAGVNDGGYLKEIKNFNANTVLDKYSSRAFLQNIISLSEYPKHISYLSHQLTGTGRKEHNSDDLYDPYDITLLNLVYKIHDEKKTKLSAEKDYYEKNNINGEAILNKKESQDYTVIAKGGSDWFKRSDDGDWETGDNAYGFGVIKQGEEPFATIILKEFHPSKTLQEGAFTGVGSYQSLNSPFNTYLDLVKTKEKPETVAKFIPTKAEMSSAHLQGVKYTTNRAGDQLVFSLFSGVLQPFLQGKDSDVRVNSGDLFMANVFIDTGKIHWEEKGIVFTGSKDASLKFKEIEHIVDGKGVKQIVPVYEGLGKNIAQGYMYGLAEDGSRIGKGSLQGDNFVWEKDQAGRVMEALQYRGIAFTDATGGKFVPNELTSVVSAGTRYQEIGPRELQERKIQELKNERDDIGREPELIKQGRSEGPEEVKNGSITMEEYEKAVNEKIGRLDKEINFEHGLLQRGSFENNKTEVLRQDIMGMAALWGKDAQKRDVVVDSGIVVKGKMEFNDLKEMAINANLPLNIISVVVNKSQEESKNKTNESGVSQMHIQNQRLTLENFKNSYFNDGTIKEGFFDLRAEGTHLLLNRGISDRGGLTLEPTFGYQGNILSLGGNVNWYVNQLDYIKMNYDNSLVMFYEKTGDKDKEQYEHRLPASSLDKERIESSKPEEISNLKKEIENGTKDSISFVSPEDFNKVNKGKENYTGNAYIVGEAGKGATLVRGDEFVGRRMLESYAQIVGSNFAPGIYKPKKAWVWGDSNLGDNNIVGEGRDLVYVDKRAVSSDWDEDFSQTAPSSTKNIDADGYGVGGLGGDYQRVMVPAKKMEEEMSSKDRAAWENIKSRLSSEKRLTKVNYNGDDYYIIPVRSNSGILRDEKGGGRFWGLFNSAKDDVDVFVLDESGNILPFSKYIDTGGSWKIQTWKNWFDSDLGQAVNDFIQQGPEAKFRGSPDDGLFDIGRNNWTIKSGDKFYNMEGGFVESAMMQIFRQQPNDFSAFQALSKAMSTNDYVDELVLNIGELSAEGAATIGLTFVPFDAGIAGEMLAATKAVRTARRIFGFYKATTKTGKAVQAARFALGQYNLWGAGITAYSEMKSLIINQELLDPLTATGIYTSSGRDAALYSLAFKALAPLTRYISKVSKVSDAYQGRFKSLENVVTNNKWYSLKGIGARAILDAPVNLATGAVIGAGRAAFKGDDPSSWDFWQMTLTSAVLFSAVAPVVKQAMVTRRLSSVGSASGASSTPATSGSGGSPDSLLTYRAAFNKRYMQIGFPVSGGVAVSGAGVAGHFINKYRGNNKEPFKYSGLVIDFGFGLGATAALASLMKWNKDFRSDRYAKEVSAEGDKASKAMINNLKTWALVSKGKNVIGYVPWPFVWMAGDITIDYLHKKEIIGLHWQKSLHQLNNVVALASLAKAFSSKPANSEGKNGITNIFTKKFWKEKWPKYWESDPGSGRMGAKERLLGDGLILGKNFIVPVKYGGNTLEWAGTLSWIFGGQYLFPEGEKYDDIHYAVSLILFGGKLLGPAIKDFDKVHREWFGPKGVKHPWQLALNVAGDTSHIIPQLAVFMPVLPYIQGFLSKNSEWRALRPLLFAFDVGYASEEVLNEIQKIRGLSREEVIAYAKKNKENNSQAFKDLFNKIDKGSEVSDNDIEQAREALRTIYLDEKGVEGTIRRALDLNIDLKQGFQGVLKAMHTKELETAYQNAIGINKIEYAKILNEIGPMSSLAFQFHNAATAAWEGAKTGIYFGPTMYMVRPLLAPGLSTMPVLADIQAILGEEILGDRVFDWKTKGPVGRFFMGAQGFFMEEYFREFITTIALRPLFNKIGGIFASPNRANYSSYAEYIAAQSRYQQVMEWFQESFEGGQSTPGASSLTRSFKPAIPSNPLSLKPGPEMKRYAQDNPGKMPTGISITGRDNSGLNINSDGTLIIQGESVIIGGKQINPGESLKFMDDTEIVLSSIKGLKDYGDQDGFTDLEEIEVENKIVGTKTKRHIIYIDEGLVKDQNKFNEVVIHEINELTLHRAKAKEKELSMSGYAKFLRSNPNREEVMNIIIGAHNQAVGMSGASNHVKAVDEKDLSNGRYGYYHRQVVDIVFPQDVDIHMEKGEFLFLVNKYWILSDQDRMMVDDILSRISSDIGKDRAYVVLGIEGGGSFEQQRELWKDKRNKDLFEMLEITASDREEFEIRRMISGFSGQNDIKKLYDKAMYSQNRSAKIACGAALLEKLTPDQIEDLLKGKALGIDANGNIISMDSLNGASGIQKIDTNYLMEGMAYFFSQDDSGIADRFFGDSAWERGKIKRAMIKDYKDKKKVIESGPVKSKAQKKKEAKVLAKTHSENLARLDYIEAAYTSRVIPDSPVIHNNLVFRGERLTSAMESRNKKMWKNELENDKAFSSKWLWQRYKHLKALKKISLDGISANVADGIIDLSHSSGISMPYTLDGKVIKLNKAEDDKSDTANKHFLTININKNSPRVEGARDYFAPVSIKVNNNERSEEHTEFVNIRRSKEFKLEEKGVIDNKVGIVSKVSSKEDAIKTQIDLAEADRVWVIDGINLRVEIVKGGVKTMRQSAWIEAQGLKKKYGLKDDAAIKEFLKNPPKDFEHESAILTKYI